MDMEDERQTELDCIIAIFPEIQLHPGNPFCATIDLPVHPTVSVKVNFPVSSDGGGANLPTPPDSIISGHVLEENDDVVTDVESHNLSYLPSIQLRLTLPEGYPEEKPAKFELTTTPEWLSRAHLDELEQKAKTMWEDAGRSPVVFEYIDTLQQAAENAFGFADGKKTLEIPQDFMISLLDFDIKATQAAFEKETFDCGVCLDPKKGTVCHRMIDCGHVFCVQCLQDFYNNAITEGDLVSVRCLAPDCAKKREEQRVATKKHRKPKTQLSPNELLQIPLEQEMVTRYVKLKHKAELESDKNTVYCPRRWCQGAAKSKKHRKPDGLDDDESSDDESESEQSGKDEKIKFSAQDDRLAVCEDCDFAFCSRCFSSWHGEFKICRPKITEELSEEEKASLEYLRMHTTPCPTCAAPAQKTHGCNHMICFKCHSHFCYLCSAWLLPANPYEHYNTETQPCYMRLWELEGGDGDDVGIGFGGGVRGVEIPPEEDDDDDDDVEEDALVAVVAELNLAPNNGLDVPEILEPPEALRPEMQREGPLVLRINQMPPPPVLAPAAPEPPPAIGHRRRGPHRQVQRNGPAPPAARRPARGNAQRAGHRNAAVDDQDVREDADRAWIRMFVQMAQNDEEDLLPDDEVDGAVWEIQHR